LTWRGKLALLREPFAPPSTAGEDESVHAYAARRLGVEAARAIVAPFVTGVYAADAHDISLDAGFPKLAALDAAGGLVRGMVAQLATGMIDRVRGRTTARTPRGMWAPVGGVGALIAGLEAALAGRVRHGVTVRAIEPVAGGVRIDGERWDGAVLAIPADQAIAVVNAALPELATKLGGFYRAPAAIVYLGMPASAVPNGADGFGLLVAQGEDLRVLGIVFESTVWRDRAPAGQVLLRCIFGGGRDPGAAMLPDSELIALARRDVERTLGATSEPCHTSVIRWPRGVAQYRLGHRDRVREAVATARRARIVLAGADYRGPGVNDLCADGAVIAAEVAAWS
jgi:oxygen-dependent protoporphyrinogen oxidase